MAYIIRYIVLERCLGTLEHAIKMPFEKQLPPKEVMCFQLLNGLRYIHSQGLVVRDIKPTNILISDDTPSAQLKLADFGLCKELSPTLSHSVSGSCRGTQIWMAPELLEIGARMEIRNMQQDEQKARESVTIKSDIFSMGCILFYVVTDGKHPFGEIIPSIPHHIIRNERVGFEGKRHTMIANS